MLARRLRRKRLESAAAVLDLLDLQVRLPRELLGLEADHFDARQRGGRLGRAVALRAPIAHHFLVRSAGDTHELVAQDLRPPLQVGNLPGLVRRRQLARQPDAVLGRGFLPEHEHHRVADVAKQGEGDDAHREHHRDRLGQAPEDEGKHVPQPLHECLDRKFSPQGCIVCVARLQRLEDNITLLQPEPHVHLTEHRDRDG